MKKNQKKLYQTIESITMDEKTAFSKFTELLKSRGRTERRTVWASLATDEISKTWTGVNQLIKVHRRVKENGVIREEYAFFTSVA